MKTGLIAIATLCLGLSAPGARAQEDSRPSDYLKEQGAPNPPAQIQERDNPAREYFRVWDRISYNERRELNEAASADFPERGPRLDKNARRLCEQYRDYIDAIIRSANAGECEWGVNADAGWMATLPHLGLLRGSLRLIRMDAYRCLDDRSYAAAAERVAAIIRMSDQTRSDRLLISALVGAAMCDAGLRLVESMVKEGQVTPASARLLLSALNALPRKDTFGSAGAVQGERYFNVEWSRHHYKGERAGMILMKEMDGIRLSGIRVGTDPLSQFICGMNEQQLNADLDRFDKYYDAVAAAWDKPNHRVLLRELSTEVWEGQYGQVARVMAPSLERTAQVVDKARADIDRVTQQLQEIIQANEAPLAEAHAAK